MSRPAGLGAPRLHLRRVESTNSRGRQLAGAGAPHGTLVTAAEQTAGRGRQGRRWVVVPGRSIAMSVVLRSWPRLLPLAAGVAVAEEAGAQAAVKWPNDVLIGGRKVAGILVEGRPQEGWMVLGIGLNVAVGPDDLPAELRATAGGLGREPAALEPTLASLLARLERWLAAEPERVLEQFRTRDALAGRDVRWEGGAGRAVGVDDRGRLVVAADGGELALEAGEVHVGPEPPARRP